MSSHFYLCFITFHGWRIGAYKNLAPCLKESEVSS